MPMSQQCSSGFHQLLTEPYNAASDKFCESQNCFGSRSNPAEVLTQEKGRD